MAKSGVNFDSILDKSIDDIEAPQPVPAGTYRGVIAGVPQEDSFTGKDEKTGEERTVPLFIIPISLLEATDGVDMDLLDKAGGLRRKDGKPREVRLRMYAAEEDLYKLKKLYKSCGIDASSIRAGNLELPGKEVLVDVQTQQSQKDPEEWFNRAVKAVGTAGA